MCKALILLALLTSGEDRFFKRTAVEFWGPKPERRVPAGPLEHEAPLPRPVRALLNSPTPAHARAYLAWQRERLSRIRKAIELVRKVSRENHD